MVKPDGKDLLLNDVQPGETIGDIGAFTNNPSSAELTGFFFFFFLFFSFSFLFLFLFFPLSLPLLNFSRFKVAKMDALCWKFPSLSCLPTATSSLELEFSFL